MICTDNLLVAYEVTNEAARDCFIQCLYVPNCHAVRKGLVGWGQASPLCWRSEDVYGTASNTDRKITSSVGTGYNWERCRSAGQNTEWPPVPCRR